MYQGEERTILRQKARLEVSPLAVYWGQRGQVQGSLAQELVVDLP
jgi:hypothetical protein